MYSCIILDEGALREVTAEFLRHDAFFFDCEAVGEHRGIPHLNELTWLSLATDGLCYVIPFGHPIGDRIIGQHSEPRIISSGKITNHFVPDYEDAPKQIGRGVVFDILEPLFMSPRLIKIAHGASYDLASVPKYYGGRQVAQPIECNIVLDWCLNENRLQYGLKQRTKQLWGVEYDDKNVGKEIEKVPFTKAAKYAFMDARYGWLQWRKNKPGIRRQHLEEMYELECQILQIMVDMRQRGARVDMKNLENLREVLSLDLENCEDRLYEVAGKPFNINSVPQKQRLLYGAVSDGGQGLDGWKLTDGGRQRQDMGFEPEPTDYSTDDEALASFPGNKLASTLREYGDIDKLLNTYVLAWLGIPAPEDQPWVAAHLPKIYDGRIFADFVQYGTKTGRFSCRAPNLQNIPRGDTEHGKMLRDAWIADPGCQLCVSDYGQIEPRLMAHYLGCGMLYEGFLKGMDPYIVNASAALGKDPGDITKGERQTYGKTMFLAMGYGLGYKGLAGKFNVSESAAKKIIARHETNMPEVSAYKEALIRKAKSVDGVPYIRTLLGRKRRVPELLSGDTGMRARAERQLFNSLIQGGAADLMKLAMVRTYENLRGIPGAYIALTVHDELALNGPREYIEDVADALRDGMIGPGIQKLVNVPLKADVVIGDRWGECK